MLEARCFKPFGDVSRAFLAPLRKARYHGSQIRLPGDRMEQLCEGRAEISRRYKRSGEPPPGDPSSPECRSGSPRAGGTFRPGEIARAFQTSDPRSSRSRSRSILHEPLFPGGAATEPSLRAATPNEEFSIAHTEGHHAVEIAYPCGSGARAAAISCRASWHAAARGCAWAARTYAQGN